VWVMTTRGFYSVVQDDEDPDTLLVRARVRGDLERLGEIIEGLELWHDPAADYAWRAPVARSEWAYALGVLAGEIDYRNFKEAVAERQGEERASVYGQVWSALYWLQAR
jgi:hypothetical protein